MEVSVRREKVRFNSGDAECAAWYYPGSNGACVIMAGGFGVTKEPATDLFAKRFNEAEIRRLLAHLTSAVTRPLGHALAWSHHRRAHLARARSSHYWRRWLIYNEMLL